MGKTRKMDKQSKIYVAGATGMVGSAICRALQKQGYTNIITVPHSSLDLTRQDQVEQFFSTHRPDYVFHPAGKVGGIGANSQYPADFMYENMMMGLNILNTAFRSGVKKLLFLGSSCIYPRLAPQPMVEDCLLTSSLEQTNEAYALAKISILRMCEYLNRQYGTNFISVMPTNLYGPNDNYDPFGSHVLPALIRRFHEAKVNGLPSVACWGDGSPLREFLFVDDLAELCVYLMERYDVPSYHRYCSSHGITPNGMSVTSVESAGDNGKHTVVTDRTDGVHTHSDCGDKPTQTTNGTGGTGGTDNAGNGGNMAGSEGSPIYCETINAGTGKEITIRDLTELVAKVVGYNGRIDWDTTKPNGTPRKLLDVSKAAKLGWTYKTELEDGLRLTYQDFVENYDRYINAPRHRPAIPHQG